MLNQNNQQNEQMQQSTHLPPQQQFGGHELMDAHEAIGALTGGLEHFVIYEQHIQDTKLSSIMQRQKTFLNQLYNTIVDTLKTGQDPAVKTKDYNMVEGNQSMYGMKPTAPKTPIQSISELTDECISGAVLGHLKGIATHFTTTALEATNPVLRRVFSDSIPNVIELAYEMYLYQNEHQYYQVPQLQQQDMQALTNSYAPIQGNMSH